MEAKLRNKYFILRHGETTHQTQEKHLVYYWPDSNPPVSLTKKGQTQIKEIAKYLKDKKIDLIFSSDIFRTRQTAGIIAKELNLQVKQDLRLRDINWGIYQGKTTKEAWAYYKHNMEEKFKKAPPDGESWNELKERMIDFIKEIEKKYNQKNILIVSHGDPLWLLDTWAHGLDDKEALKSRKEGCPIKTGDLKELN